MALLTIALLVGVIGLLWRQLWLHRRGIVDLERALKGRSRYLIEEEPSLNARAWLTLAETANGVIDQLIASDAARDNQMHQLEATLGSLQEGVLVLDEDNHIILANKALESIFSSGTFAIGGRVESAAHNSAFLSFLADIHAGRAAPNIEVEFSGSSGSVWLEVTGTLIRPAGGGRMPWLLCVLHDITRQKRLEGMRKDFVANVSHELRTPLSVIKGFVETLVDDHNTLPVEDRDRFLRTIQRHTERLQGILEDLLTLSRLESSDPGLRREPLDIARFLGQLADDYRQRFAATDHRLEWKIDPGLPEIAADADRLAQVFANLLDNGIKYTPPQSIVTIAVRRSGEEIEVSVGDNGPGIPTADLPRIFERFYRVDKGRSREKGGTGLGLSIVKHIVHLHGGRVWAESEMGKGTAIIFTLPLSGAASRGD